MISLQILSGCSFCNTRARSLAATAINKDHSCSPGPLLKSFLDQPASVAAGSQNVHSVSYYYPDAGYRPENQAAEFAPPFFVGAPPTVASKAGPHRRPPKRSDQSCHCYILASSSDIHQTPEAIDSHQLMSTLADSLRAIRTCRHNQDLPENQVVRSPPSETFGYAGRANIPAKAASPHSESLPSIP